MESVSNCSSPMFVYVRSARIAGSSSPARSAPRGKAMTYFDDRLLGAAPLSPPCSVDGPDVLRVLHRPVRQRPGARLPYPIAPAASA